MAGLLKNMAWWDRMVRYLLGVLLLSWAIAGGPWWTLLGVFPLATAAFGYCPGYWLLGRSTKFVDSSVRK